MSRAKERLKGGKETKDSVTLLPCFYFVELPILASSIVSLYFLELTDIFQPVHSGYSCNDRSLSLPYILPRQEVCPLPLLFSLAFAAPTVTAPFKPPSSPPPASPSCSNPFHPLR
ncbi:lipid phosphate phosphatase-related protein type 4-like [Pundamilia nyererei]|uniref:Lipid phosphate phosphatase-related protein type 4-like n=1 Tax=Pundamilia nyererei TaxID=303518 RepID=A0A9Y3SA72_9CICH|nr:PREDICTED: lipid phosphate phosphatase-related protein type 4-like [Pundamilia nyererei]